jgi:TATA-binding protein-associated factor Taf7
MVVGYSPRLSRAYRFSNQDADEELEDNMDEIDTGNIIPDGRRTRGKTIDYAKAAEDAKNAGEDLDDEEEDDDDFEEKEDREHDEDDVMRD